MLFTEKGDFAGHSAKLKDKNGGSIGFYTETPPKGARFEFFSISDIQNWQVLNSESEVSTGSILARSIVGSAIAGTAGGIIGGLSAKNKTEYLVLLEYGGQYKSIVSMNDSDFNKFKRMMAMATI